MMSKKRTTYLLAWVGEDKGIPVAFFERSDARKYRESEKISAGVSRGEHTVVVFCDYIHGEEYLTKDELRLVAACYLDGKYITHEIDFRA